jgi:hypothetical protein
MRLAMLSEEKVRLKVICVIAYFVSNLASCSSINIKPNTYVCSDFRMDKGTIIFSDSTIQLRLHDYDKNGKYYYRILRDKPYVLLEIQDNRNSPWEIFPFKIYLDNENILYQVGDGIFSLYCKL